MNFIRMSSSRAKVKLIEPHEIIATARMICGYRSSYKAYQENAPPGICYLSRTDEPFETVFAILLMTQALTRGPQGRRIFADDSLTSTYMVCANIMFYVKHNDHW